MEPDLSTYRGDMVARAAIAADAGRGLGTGRFFTRDRRHLATVVQEGMIRANLQEEPR